MFIELYTKDKCPNCEQTKQLLNSRDVNYTEHTVGKDISREAVLAKFPGAKVVPIVVVDGNVTTPGALKQLINE